jgi:hypothetical protein
VLLVALVAAVVVVVRLVWDRTHRSDLERALGMVPAASLRVAFTDWAQVRRLTGVGETTDRDRIDALMSKAYDADLAGSSSISESAAALQEHLGFSSGTADWEAYAQSREGATMVMRMADDVDLDDIRAQLASSGFQKPDDKDGVWRGGVDLVAMLDPTITPELQYVSVLDDEHAVLTSDDPSYAAKAADIAQGDGKSLAEAVDTGVLTDPLSEPPVSAMLWSRDFACEDLAMSAADDNDQQRAQDLVDRAGELTPLSGLLMAMDQDRALHVIEAFESADQAKENLRARAELAVGEAVGRGGSFSDDFRLTRSATHGAAVVLVLEPKQETGFVLSALDNGPVLFATC